MKAFTGFTAEASNPEMREILHAQLSNIFGLAFKEEVYQKMALTLTCFKYDVDNKLDNPRYYNINKALYSFVFLINSIKHILYAPTIGRRQKDEITKAGLSGKTDYGLEDLEDEEDQFSKRYKNTRTSTNGGRSKRDVIVDDIGEIDDGVVVNNMDGVDEDDDDDVDVDDDDDEDVDDDMGRDDTSENPRLHMDGITVASSQEGVTVTNDGGADEFVYITRKGGYIILILPLMNTKLTTHTIKEFMSELYSTSKRRDNIDPDVFTSGLCKDDFCKAYNQLKRETGSGKNINNSHIKDPTDMFNSKELFGFLENIDDGDLLNNTFFAPNYDNNAEGDDEEEEEEDEEDEEEGSNTTCKDPVRNMHESGLDPVAFKDTLPDITPQVIIEYDYKISISEFDYDTLTTTLLPWTKPNVADFLLKFCNSKEEDTNVFLTKVRGELYTRNSNKPRRDTLDALATFTQHLKDQNKGVLTEEDALKCIEVFKYVIENKKIISKMSPFNAAISNNIVERRNMYGCFGLIGPLAFNKEAMKIIDENINKLLNKAYRETNAAKYVGPFSKFLMSSCDNLRNYNTVPKEYQSLVCIIPFLTADSQNRQDGQRFNVFLIGPKESGKNYISDEIADLTLAGSSEQCPRFSKQAFTTGDPYDGGWMIMHEPPEAFTMDQNKLNSADKDMLNIWKEVVSSSVFAYRVFEFDETNGKKSRGSRLIMAQMRMNMRLTANLCTNKNQAFMSRFFYVPITKSTGHETLDYIAKNKTIKDNERIGVKTAYTEIVLITQLMQMLISCGIIEKPEIGIGHQMYSSILGDLKYSGIKDSGSPRNFSRANILFHNLILARTVVEQYFIIDDDDIRHPEYERVKFRYEDMLELSKSYHMTTEDLVIGTNFLWRQYIDPIKADITNTFLRKYTSYNLENVQVSAGDIEEGLDTYFKIYNDGKSRKKPDPVDDDDDDDDDDDENAGDVDMDGSGGQNGWVGEDKINTSGMTVAGVDIGGSNIMGNVRDLVGGGRSTYAKRTRITEPLAASVVETQADINFVIAIKRLDKMMCEYVSKKQENIKIRKIVSTASYDLNYMICDLGATEETKKQVAAKILFSMTKEPIIDNIEEILQSLEAPKHTIPVHFNSVSEKIMNKIINMYKTKATDYARFKFLAELFTNDEAKAVPHTVGHENLEKTHLFKYIRGRRDATTRIIFSPFMFAAASPDTINLSIKKVIETVHTKTAYIYSPRITQNTNDSDMGFMKIQKNKRKDTITVKNPAYIEEGICRLNMEMNINVNTLGIKYRKKGNTNMSNKAKEVRFLSESVKQREKFEAIIELRKHETVSIESDFDGFIKSYKKKKALYNL